MATSWCLELDMPLRADVSENDAIRVANEAFSLTGHDNNPGGADRPALIANGFSIELSPPNGCDMFEVIDGHLRCSLWVENLSYNVGTEFVDGVEIKDSRIRASLILRGLFQICGAPAGMIVGALGSEHVEVLGPLIMTEDGLRYACSIADDPYASYGYGEAKETIPIKIIPLDSITNDVDCDWRCSVDPTKLVRPFAVIEQGPNAVLR